MNGTIKTPQKASFAIQTPTELLFEYSILGSEFWGLNILAINCILFSNCSKCSEWKFLTPWCSSLFLHFLRISYKIFHSPKHMKIPFGLKGILVKLSTEASQYFYQIGLEIWFQFRWNSNKYWKFREKWNVYKSINHFKATKTSISANKMKKKKERRKDQISSLCIEEKPAKRHPL